MKTKLWNRLVALVFFLLLTGCSVVFKENSSQAHDYTKLQRITSFADCEKAGGDIAESYPRQCFFEKLSFVEKIDVEPPSKVDASRGYALLCRNMGGNWNELYQECEGMPQETCENFGGTFNACASDCRHDPDAKICNRMCVIVCDLNKEKEKTACEKSGGSWESVGKLGVPDCIYSYSDAGKLCQHSSECQGDCIVTEIDGSDPHCAADNDRFGCQSTIEMFREENAILCVD